MIEMEMKPGPLYIINGSQQEVHVWRCGVCGRAWFAPLDAYWTPSTDHQHGGDDVHWEAPYVGVELKQ